MMEIGAALTSAKTLYDTARAAMEARDDAKLKTAMVELQGKLHDATQAAITSISEAMTLQKDLRAAQDELAEIKRKQADRERYALTQLPGEGKQFAFARKPSAEGEDEPPHYLCQGCYDKGFKFVLQGTEGQFWWEYSCPGCKTTLRL